MSSMSQEWVSSDSDSDSHSIPSLSIYLSIYLSTNSSSRSNPFYPVAVYTTPPNQKKTETATWSIAKLTTSQSHRNHHRAVFFQDQGKRHTTNMTLFYYCTHCKHQFRDPGIKRRQWWDMSRTLKWNLKLELGISRCRMLKFTFNLRDIGRPGLRLQGENPRSDGFDKSSFDDTTSREKNGILLGGQAGRLDPDRSFLSKWW